MFIISDGHLGKVEENAIVTTMKTGDLMDYLKQATMIRRTLLIDKFGTFSSLGSLRHRLDRTSCPMDHESGRAVGSLSIFMRIPMERREQFAAKIASGWRLRGFERAKPNKTYEDFMNGVFSVEGDILTNDDNRINDATSDIITAKRFDCEARRTVFADQQLIDKQILNELSFSLRGSATALQADRTSSGQQNEISDGVTQTSRESSAQERTQISCEPSSLAKLRDSSLFTFERPKFRGGTTDWEVTTNRDVSPTPTVQSALDTFTKELLAKAEEASTVGSFGRDPSAARADSVRSLPFRDTPIDLMVREEVYQHVKSTPAAREPASEEDPMVIDLSTDEESDDSVEEVDFVVLSSRTIRK